MILLPSACLGEIAALLTSASNRPPAIRLISGNASRTTSTSDRSIWMWLRSPPGQGQRGIEGVAGDRQHAPSLAAEALDGGVADATAGTGQQQNRFLAGGHDPNPSRCVDI